MTAPARPLTARERQRVNAEVGRQQQARVTAIAAAATPVNKDKRTGTFKLRERESWQDDVFAYVGSVPELSYAEMFVGNAFSKVRLFAAVQPDPDLPPMPLDAEGSPLTPREQEQALAEMARLKSARGSQSRIMSRLGSQTFLVGECYLVGKPAQEEGPAEDAPPGATVVLPQSARPESWEVLSIAELTTKGSGANSRLVEVDDQGNETLLPLGTLAVRIHQEDVVFRSRARSSVKAVLDAMEELAILCRVIRATGKSRIAQGSIVGVPTSLSSPPIDPDTGAVTGPSPVAFALREHFMTPIGDEGSASAAAPFIIEGEGSSLKEMKDSVIQLSRPLDAVMAAQRLELRQTIATGINLPPEILTGKASLNHWSAFNVDDDLFRAHLEPGVITACDALTLGLLRAALMVPVQDGGPGWTQDRADLVCVWFDASALIAGPNLAESADFGVENGLVAGEAWRRAKGWSEDDAPDEAEMAQRLAARARIPAQGRPAAEAAPVRAAVTAAARPRRNRGESLSRRLLDIDRDLRARVETECESAMLAALTRAGNRIANAAQRKSGQDTKTVIASVRRDELAASLGRPVVAALGMTDAELLADAFTDLGSRFDLMVASAQAAVVDELVDALGLSPDTVQAFVARQAQNRLGAVAVLTAGMIALAAARLFDARADAPALGEAAGSTVPVDLVRRAVTVAGGGSAGTASVTQTAEVEVRGGVGIGADVYDLMERSGARQEEYEWVYGVTRSGSRFMPHVNLTGVRFASFTDEVLVNRDSWPPVGHFAAGDHAGCSCDAYPVWMLADDERFNPGSSDRPADVDEANARETARRAA